LASRDDVYLAVGKAIELCQLLETEIGTALLAIDGLETRSYTKPNAEAYIRLQEAIDSQTLGRSLAQIKKRLDVSENLETLFAEALEARNFLTHRFYAHHGFRIFDAEGCDRMVAHVDQLRCKLNPAYSTAQNLSELLVNSLHLAKHSLKRSDA
jgi:hypothetical protein